MLVPGAVPGPAFRPAPIAVAVNGRRWPGPARALAFPVPFPCCGWKRSCTLASSVPQLHCFGMQPPRARQVARLWDHALVAALRAVVRVGGICIKDNPRPGSTAVLRTIKKNHERLRDRKESKRVRRRMNVLLLLAASVCLISAVGGKKELAAADLQAWQALYDATGGNDTWTRCAKYRDNPCKCPRVECPYTHIETIDLGDSGLQGAFSGAGPGPLRVRGWGVGGWGGGACARKTCVLPRAPRPTLSSLPRRVVQAKSAPGRSHARNSDHMLAPHAPHPSCLAVPTIVLPTIVRPLISTFFSLSLFLSLSLSLSLLSLFSRPQGRSPRTSAR